MATGKTMPNKLPRDRMDLAKALYDIVNGHMVYAKKGTGWGEVLPSTHCHDLISGSISFCSSSNEMAPTAIWPLMKKVGVEPTLNCLAARSRTHSMPSSTF